MQNASLEQMIEAKVAFKYELAKHSVQVKEYCANNSRFADLSFRKEVKKCN